MKVLLRLPKRSRFNLYPTLFRAREAPQCRFYSGSPATSQEQLVDICIVGGGVVGSALAAGLASNPMLANHSISIIDAGDLSKVYEPKENSWSNRVVSITPGSMEFLNQIGATNHFNPTRPHPYTQMRVWDALSPSTDPLRFDSDPVAYMVEMAELQSGLNKLLNTKQDRITKLDRTKVVSISKSSSNDTSPEHQGLDISDWPTISLSNGTTLRARLLIGADGQQSPVRTFAKIESIGWDYQQRGIVATMKISGSSIENGNTTAWQRFLPTGPIAMLPLSNDTSSLVWTLPTSLSEKLVQTTPTKFVLALNAAFQNQWPDVQYILRNFDNLTEEEIQQEISWGLDRVRDSNDIVRVDVPSVMDVVDTSRAAFPLKLRHATNYIDNRIALVGDAAHAIHPLAGQGLNLGLADAKALTETITRAVSSGSDIGSVIALEPYFRDRFGANAVMLQACDTIQKVFGSHYATTDKVLEMENGGAWRMMVSMRSFVMKSVNSVGPVKDLIMKYAMA